jgi:hypothetical protein
VLVLGCDGWLRAAAVLGCWPGEPGELSLHFFFKFLFSVFIYYLIFLFEFRSDFYFVLQVLKYLNINTF